MSVEQPELHELSTQTQRVYERNARNWAKHRPKALIEQQWLDRFLQFAPRQGTILDLGCGAGDPIAKYFIENNRTTIGVDACVEMIKLARNNFPNEDWRIQDMRSLNLPEKFAGIIGWNSFFHLTKDEQRAVLPVLADYLVPDGSLLLTVGPDDGEVAGYVCDDSVYHASLSPTEYQNILTENGLTIKEFVLEDPQCYGMTLLLAQKSQ